MVFTTLTFMVFMAIVTIIYYHVPQKWQWIVLLLASYFFYAWASPLYLLFLLVTTAITYFCAICIETMQTKHAVVLWISTAQLLLLMIVFKYSTFLLKNVASLAALFGISIKIPSLHIILPLGLSFYIFQGLGYCIDVYREIVPAERNFFKYALFVSFFPQLLQGPIGKYETLVSQFFSGHTFSYKPVVFGMQRTAWGFFKKLVIANQIAVVIDGTWANYANHRGFLLWACILCLYAIQLYADFSGYMDIAMGCAQMLGIRLAENFDTPYFSHSIAEFWRRWHITLGAWFKDYVFYPLLRSKMLSALRKHWRKKNSYLSNTVPTVISLLIVWILIGFWHGADWSYVMYGLFHGCFIILSTVFEPLILRIHATFPKLKKHKWFSLFQILRTFAIVTFGYVIFRPANLALTVGILRQMKHSIGISELFRFVSLNFKELSMGFLGTVVLFAVDLFHETKSQCSIREKVATMKPLVRWSIYILFLCAILLLGAYGRPELDQFAYFRF